MAVGAHVFGDGRLGIWMMNPGNLRGRLAKLRALGVTDFYLPREATRNDLDAVRQSGGFAHLFVIPHGRDALTFAKDTLADIDRLKPGAVELNVEIPDSEISTYVRQTVNRIRRDRPSARLRVNLAPLKAQWLPMDLVQADANLYVIAQAYYGNMDGIAAVDDVRRNLTGWGVPESKGAIMYGAHVSPALGEPRVPALPSLTSRQIERGSIYNDDLMADAGYLD